MGRPEVKRAAAALRRHVRQHAASVGTGRYEAVVTSTSPLAADVLTLDMQVTAEDVTIGGALAAYFTAHGPLAVGDSLGLVETEPGEFVAFEVLRA